MAKPLVPEGVPTFAGPRIYSTQVIPVYGRQSSKVRVKGSFGVIFRKSLPYSKLNNGKKDSPVEYRKEVKLMLCITKCWE